MNIQSKTNSRALKRNLSSSEDEDITLMVTDTSFHVITKKIKFDLEELNIDNEESKLLKKYKQACRHLKLTHVNVSAINFEQGIFDLTNLKLGIEFRTLAQTLWLSSNLTHLILPGNSLGPQGLEDVALLVANNKNVKYLDIADNDLGPKSGMTLNKIVKDGRNLDHLNASENSLQDIGLKVLLPALQESTSLKELLLCQNRFLNKAVEQLGQLLATNQVKLEKLDMSYNKLRKDAKHLFVALETNTYLKELTLRSNEISVQTVICLNKALIANSTLLSLDMSWNLLSTRGIIRMCESVRKNRTLTSLNLSFNRARASSTSVLMKAVATRINKIEHLSLLGTQVNPEFLKMLNKVQRSGRNIEVKYGRGSLIRENLLNTEIECTSLEKMVDIALNKRLVLSSILGEIHETYVAEQLLKVAGQDTSHGPEDLNANTRMTGTLFVKSLVDKLGEYEPLAEKLKNDFVDAMGTVDVRLIIASIPIRLNSRLEDCNLA